MPELKIELLDVAEYEHIKIPDLIRELIRKRIQEVTGTRAYQNWKRRLSENQKGGE